MGSRLDDLAAAMPRIESRWDALNPAPTRRIPVLIGGGGEKKTLRIVARHATIWHTFTTGDVLERKLGILREHCAAVGRDPSEIEVSVAVDGDPEQSGPALLDSGARLFTIESNGPDYDLSVVEAWVAWRDKQN